MKWPFALDRRTRRSPAPHSVFARFAEYDGWAEAGFERAFYGINVRAERALQRAFRRHGWHNAFSFPCHSEARTRFGRVTFTDGVETWVHPDRADLLASLTGA